MPANLHKEILTDEQNRLLPVADAAIKQDLIDSA
jgi:hypothetical protein